jgi:hypothetical protein
LKTLRHEDDTMDVVEYCHTMHTITHDHYSKKVHIFKKIYELPENPHKYKKSYSKNLQHIRNCLLNNVFDLSFLKDA